MEKILAFFGLFPVYAETKPFLPNLIALTSIKRSMRLRIYNHPQASGWCLKLDDIALTKFSKYMKGYFPSIESRLWQFHPCPC